MQNVQRNKSEIGVVFWVSAAFALTFILWGVIAPQNFGAVTQTIFDWVVSNLGWFYLLAGNFFLLFVVVLALSRYGKLRLGKEGERPEFSRFAWFAMLFQAGMGPSLIFWGVAEPLSHYSDPPFGLANPGTAEAAQLGMQYSYFHWALHPWAMYAVVGVVVGYFSFRRDEPGLISPIPIPAWNSMANHANRPNSGFSSGPPSRILPYLPKARYNANPRKNVVTSM